MAVEDEGADFRRYVRGWFAEHAGEIAPGSDLAGESESGLAERKRVQALLYDAGLVGITWPREYGGYGRSVADQLAFNDEASQYAIGNDGFVVGTGMCAPTILQLGTELQKKRYLAPLLRGDEVWCQLFSEPGAGSDLAALQATARRDGEEWVINGQKVWTSGAHFADLGILLARTDPTLPKHDGLTMFIVDMRTPGITVRGLRVATGETPFCEVFFDDVHLPIDAVVGEVNRGWSAAVAMLSHERTSIGGATRSRTAPLSFVSLATAAHERGGADAPALRRRLAELYVYERALDLYNQRTQESAEATGRDVPLAGSIAKLARATLDRLAVRSGVEVLGSDLSGFAEQDVTADTAHEMVAVLRYAIGGGSNQIQLNIIAERILGLPKDPGTDRYTPYDQLRVGTVRG